ERDLPFRVETEPGLVRRLYHGVPSRVILRNQHGRRPDHVQGAAPLPQKLLPENICAADSPTVGVQRIVAMNGLGQIHAESVDVHLLYQKRGPANERLPHILFPEAWRAAARPV